MTIREKNAPPASEDRLSQILDLYPRVMSGIMMLLGLRQWLVIMGVMRGGDGMFEQMSTPWQIATMHLAVVDLVASVGLWMRVSWGNVVWIYAALSEIALHTIFIRTFGSDIPIVVFHILTVGGFLALAFFVRRAEAR